MAHSKNRIFQKTDQVASQAFQFGAQDEWGKTNWRSSLHDFSKVHAEQANSDEQGALLDPQLLMEVDHYELPLEKCTRTLKSPFVNMSAE